VGRRQDRRRALVLEYRLRDLTWHWIDGGDKYGAGGEIQHEDDMCTDCVMYLAYGTEPEDWRHTA
jgi:hypothetical protein